MKYWSKYLQPDTRSNTTFDEFCNCPVCKYHKALIGVVWEEGLDLLKQMLSHYTKKRQRDDTLHVNCYY